MPDINITELGRQLKAHKPSRVYLVWGSETYLKQKAIDRLLEECMPRECPEMNYCRMINSSDIDELCEQAALYPFIDERRCVLVEDLDFSSLNEKNALRLNELLSDANPDCVLIFWQNNLNGGEKQSHFQNFLKNAQRFGSVLKFDKLKYSELTNAVLEMAAQRELKLGNSEARYLTDRIGSELMTVAGELDKLSLYCGKKPVTREIIDAVCPMSLEANIYRISQNIIDKKNDDAFAAVESLLAQKTEPIEIFTRLCDTFIDLARAKAASAQGLSFEDAAKLFGSEYQKKAFTMKNAYANCSKCSTALIRRYITLLFECERRMKTGGTDRAICLEKLVAQLCYAGSGAR